MVPQTKSKLTRLLTALCIVLALGCVAVAILAMRTRQNTSLLTVRAFAKDAVISISQNDKEARIIGTGTAKVRLTTGLYEVVASSEGKVTNGQVTIQNTQPTNLTLDITPPVIPTPGDIDFKNIDTFLDYGLSNSQVANLRLLFFHYNRRAGTISVDTNSIQNGPRNPSDSTALFTLNFTGQIDGKAYKATITYSPDDLDNLRLTLFDPQTGTQFYDASSVPST